MSRPRARGVWIGVGLVLLTAAFIVLSASRDREKKTEVRIEPIRKERIESWVRAPGQVRPERLVQISSNVMGRVQGLAVAEGSRVSRGDVLLRLDDERYRSVLSGMQAMVDAARADVDLAQAQRNLSDMNLARQEKLFVESLLSDDGLERARTEATVAEARLASVREELRRRQAALSETRKDLNETLFLAPIDGIVTSLNVEEGENVMTGTMNNPGTVILTLADLDTMEVGAEVDETDVVRVQPGQTAKVRIDAWEDSVLIGMVTQVGMSGRRGGTQQQGTNFEVRVRILDAPPRLRPGMSADVEILAGERDSALAVPIQALVAHPERLVRRWAEKAAEDSTAKGGRRSRARRSTDEEPDTARVSRAEKLIEGIFLERDGKARFVPVRLGLRGDTHVEIFAEIADGDRVVTGPYRVLRKLRDGEPIRPEKKKAAARSGKREDA